MKNNGGVSEDYWSIFKGDYARTGYYISGEIDECSSATPGDINYDSIIQNNEMYGATTVYAEAGKLETVELRFNKMGDKPKRLSEMQGGMNIGAPMLLFLIGMVSWAM